MRFSIFLVCTLHWLRIAAGQHDVVTDSENCCQRLPNSTAHDSTCVPVRLTATQFQQSITTPNYPKAFAQDTFCIWEIRAMRGRRILIDVRNLHLVAHENDECKSQRLIIRSPLTGLQIGPYCGYDGLPNVVSSGNYLIVELQSPNPTNGEQYKGFQMVYSETVQATSVGLRPPEWSNGMFLEYSTTPPARTARFKPRPTRKMQNLPNTQTTKKPKKAPKQKGPKERDRFMSNSNVPGRPILTPGFYPTRIPNRIDNTKKEPEMRTEVIVGIVVGGIIVVAIVSVVVAKISQHNASKKQKRALKAEDRQSQQDPTKTQNTSYLPMARTPHIFAPIQYENRYVSHVHEKEHDRPRKTRSPTVLKTEISTKVPKKQPRTSNRAKRPVSEERERKTRERVKSNERKRNQNERQVERNTRSKSRDHKSGHKSKNTDRSNSHSSKTEKRQRRKS